MERINGMLLPGEMLPYALAGFVPDTAAAVEAYAVAVASGAADPARRTLFEAFWCHSVDLDDDHLVHTVLADTVPDRGSDEAGSGDRTAATQLVERWRAEWKGLDDVTIPVVIPEGEEPRFGVDAVTWLAEEIDRRELTFGD
jgi:hypothetical protein